MKRPNQDSELTKRLNAIRDFCRENELPVFVAAFDETLKVPDYQYVYVSPDSLDQSIPGDKFPRFLGGILGFDREDYL